MASSRLYWSLLLNIYPTQMTERVVFIEAMETFNSQGRTHYSTPILNPSRLELTPQILESTRLCACYVWDKLYAMGIDNDSRDWFTQQITFCLIDAASRFGNNIGFCANATLEFIWDTDNDGAWLSTREYIDGHIVMHDGDGGVIVMDAEDLVEQPKGASKSVIDKLRKGRFDGCADDVKGTCCPVCLEDFLPKTEVLRMPCSHLFHDNCIVRWLERNNSCPMCRKATV